MPITEFSYLSSKSISKLSFEGAMEIVLSPSLNLISLFILIILIGESLSFKPTATIFSMNSFAEPSSIGTSSLSISIEALSIVMEDNDNGFDMYMAWGKMRLKIQFTK